MKNLLLLTLIASMMGCAHGMSIPTSVDDAKGMAQDEANSKKDELDIAANEKVGDVQGQANAKLNAATAGVRDRAANLIGNAAMSKAIAVELLRRMPLIGDTKTLVYANTVGQYVAQELVPSLKCRTEGTQWSDVRVGIVKSGVPSSFSLPGGLM
jgi:hypothetical protein